MKITEAMRAKHPRFKMKRMNIEFRATQEPGIYAMFITKGHESDKPARLVNESSIMEDANFEVELINSDGHVLQ